MASQSLTKACEQVAIDFKRDVPKRFLDIMLPDWINMYENFDYTSTIQVGDTLPPFELLNSAGETVRSTDLLARGPLFIKFYRGVWCPFDKLELPEFEKHIDEFNAKGVSVIGISPELAPFLDESKEKFNLTFPLLTDKDTDYAKTKMNIFWTVPPKWHPIYREYARDLTVQHGNSAWQLPVPAAFLVDQKGVIRNAFIDADYSKRLEPTIVLKWIDEL